MLRTYVKIGLTWVVVVGVVFSITLVLPHREIKTISAIACAFDLLVAVCCFFVAAKEINKRTVAVFTYVGIFFSLTALGWPMGALMGKAFFRDNPFASVYWNQYEWATYFFMLLFVIVFGTLEAATRKLAILQKSFLSLLVAGIPFVLLYYPFFINPNYLYTIPEVRDFSIVNQAISHSQKMGRGTPELDQLVNEVNLPNRNGSQTPEQKYQRIAKIFPYLEGDNYILLIHRPLYVNALYMGIIGLMILLAMLGYCYWNDWPKSAYLEKILISFIPICVLECIHAFSFVILSDVQVFQHIFGVGTILTRISYAFVLFFLVLRLNFISSPAGNFYENKLSTDPFLVSRWRDVLDEFIIRRFLNPQKLRGRLFFSNDPPETGSTLNQ